MEADEPVQFDQSYVRLVLMWLASNNRSGVADFTKPHIKPSLRYVYPLFVFLYILVMLAGTAGNATMLVFIARRRRLYRDPTQLYLANLALSDLLKAALVLPLTLVGQLLQNWILGGFLCYFLPMMQSFLVYATVLTHVVIAVDRYRLVVHPMKLRPSARLCILATWVTAVCVVLPYALFIKFIDLAQVLHRDQFEGVGICWQNLERHIEEYIRAMFISLYCMPLAIIAFLNVKVSMELKTMHEDEELNSAASSVLSSVVSSRRASALTRPSSTQQMASPITDEHGHLCPPHTTDRFYTQPNYHHSHSLLNSSSASGSTIASAVQFTQALSQGQGEPPGGGGEKGGGGKQQSLRMKSLTFSEQLSETRPFRSHSTTSSLGPSPFKSKAKDYDDDDGYGEASAEVNVAAEQRSQRYLVTMVTLYALCWFPVNVLILATHFVYETDDSAGHLDISYLIFTFFGFLSTCVNPVLFTSWRMSTATKDRLRECLRLQGLRGSKAEEAGAGAGAGTGAGGGPGGKQGGTSTGASSITVSHSPTADTLSPTHRMQLRTYSGTHIRIGVERTN